MWVLLVIGLAALAPLGCFSGGGFEVERDPSVLAFADRIQSFYDSIEEIPLDVELTYGNSELRAFFASEGDFAAYYASLAAQLRRAQVRNTTLNRVSIVEFRFDGDSIARVDLVLTGKHERSLRLGALELQRQDTWQRLDGRWLVTPDKL
jgi:hypothetical protein